MRVARRPTRRGVGAIGAVLLGVVLLAPVTVVSPAAAEVDDDEVCMAVRPDGDYAQAPEDATSVSEIAEPLRLAAAHSHATGKGIGVAVIDTGLAPGVGDSGRLTVSAPSDLPGVRRKVYDGHGTWVAGLIAGHREGEVVGVAPDAHVVPIRVADAGRAHGADDRRGELAAVTADRITRGIREAISRRGADNIRVINISLSVREPDKALEHAVRDATDAGILVVAAAGNRPQPEGDDAYRDGFRPGEDRVVHPARYDDVLAVTALAPDLSLAPQYVETGPGVDVAAPTVGAKTIGVGGRTCLLPTVATSWAAAQVSGLAALVFERYPDITVAQARARIEATARGVTSAHSLDGRGMVQPVAALTAELEITRDGRVVRGARDTVDPPPLAAPQEKEDTLPVLRDRLLWWGLLAGGGLVLALLLRPLARRRS